MSDAFDHFLEVIREVEALPPIADAILASHRVPRGRHYRQWDTRGRLLLWVSRGELEDARIRRRAFSQRVDHMAPMVIGGIPVYYV